jgi:hypothetical protein
MIRERPRRYGVITHASPVTSTTWPETNETPSVAVPPAHDRVRLGDAGALPVHDLPHETFADELEERHQRSGRRQAVPTQGEGDQGDERTDRQHAEELRLVHHRFQALRQPVDRLEDRAFRGAHGAAAGDEPARDQHDEARDGGDRVRATPD